MEIEVEPFDVAPFETSVVQRSEDWFRQRIGKVTASNVHKVCSRGKNGALKSSYWVYFYSLLGQRLGNFYEEGGTSPSMWRGIKNEPAARELYSSVTGFDVLECGFIDHPEISMSGASPDGLVGNSGLIEIKCPSSHNHLAFALTGDIDVEYIYQMQFQMDCTGREWCDYVSYCDSFSEGSGLRILTKRVNRDDELLVTMREYISEFVDRLQRYVDKCVVSDGGFTALSSDLELGDGVTGYICT